jgi:hypothetical protein
VNAGRRCKHKFELMERFIPLNEAGIPQMRAAILECFLGAGRLEFAGKVG